LKTKIKQQENSESFEGGIPVTSCHDPSICANGQRAIRHGQLLEVCWDRAAVNDRNSVNRCGDPDITHLTHFHAVFCILCSIEKPFIRLDNPYISCKVSHEVFVPNIECILTLCNAA
jgi:hypothetical protein